MNTNVSTHRFLSSVEDIKTSRRSSTHKRGALPDAVEREEAHQKWREKHQKRAVAARAKREALLEQRKNHILALAMSRVDRREAEKRHQRKQERAAKWNALLHLAARMQHWNGHEARVRRARKQWSLVNSAATCVARAWLAHRQRVRWHAMSVIQRVRECMSE
jgi:hypothetical protein